MQKISKWFLIKNMLAALMVKTVFYLLISLFVVWLFEWGGIIGQYNWRYVLVLTVCILLYSVMFSMAGYREFVRR